MIVTIYTQPNSRACSRALNILNKKTGIDIKVIDVESNPEQLEKMIATAAGRSTVPQIYLGDLYIGDLAMLKELEKNGSLDVMLEQHPKSL